MTSPNNPPVPTGDQQYLNQLQQEEQQQFQQFVQEIDRTVGAMFDGTPAPAPSSASGGKFNFSPEMIEDQLKQCAQLIIDLRRDQQTAENARSAVKPPAEDMAGSVMQANAYKKSLQTLYERIGQQIQFVQQWSDTLTKAKQDYMDQEHMTADQWDRLAKGLSA